MEIINPNAATLSNFEVMNVLQYLKDSPKKLATKNSKGQLATITYETLRYLESISHKQQTQESVIAFLKALEPFHLTKSEKLMILNMPPTSALEIQFIIDDSEDRLTDEQVEELVKITTRYITGQ